MRDIRISRESLPTTAYLLQFSSTGCSAGCRFCPQSTRSSASKNLLSRITWPVVELDEIVPGLRRFKRICFQTVLKPGYLKESIRVVRKLSESGVPLSLAITPVEKDVLRELKDAGVERLGVGLDAASERVFDLMNKPFSWATYLDFIKDGVSIFGRGKVHVHLIVGLGERMEELVETMKLIRSIGASTALFAFTPVRGIRLNTGSPDLLAYRRAQIIRFVVDEGIDPKRLFVEPELIKRALLTSGCPDCNRPFYNERPRGPMYNYPSLELVERDWPALVREMKEVLSDAVSSLSS